jgi:hypothetical protein
MSIIKRLFFFICIIAFTAACQDGLQQPVHMYVMNNTAETGSQFPNLYQDEQGTVYMSWIANIEEDVYALEYSKLEDDRWAPSQTIRVGTEFFVNWADFPSVVGINGEAIAVHWLRDLDIEDIPYAYDIRIAFPDEETGRWDNIITPHLDGTPTEHGFVSMEPLDSNRVLAIWLDGRNTEGRGHGEYEDYSKAMTLRSAEISRDGEISRKRVIDEAVCDCCPTDLVPVEGGYLAVYRDRTEDEVRDISITRYDLETGEWSDPVTVHDDGWQIMACPVNGPRIVSRDEYVAVAWYTGADDVSKVKLARSTNGGITFQEPIVVAEGEHVLGRTDLVLTENGSIYSSWLEKRDDAGYVMLREITPGGELAESIHVGITAATRSSGFPRIKKSDDSIIIAWTQTEPLVRVRTARVHIGREI